LARPAAAWAKTPWLVIPEDTLAADAVREMLRRRAHWLVVADREGQPVGLVTMRTLLREMDLGDFFQTQRMRDVMSTAPLTMPPEASLLDAAQAMHAQRISCVLVGTAPRPEGIFTLSDLAKASAEGVDLARTPLAARMSAPLVQVGAEQSLLEAVAAMVAHGVRRAAVAGDDGAIVGIVTLTDVIQALGVEASGEAPMQALRAIAEAAGAEHLRVFSEEELAAIMEALPVGVVRLRWDPGAPLPAALADAPWAGEAQGAFVVDYASPNLRRILGHAPEAMKEKDFWLTHLHPEDLETFKMRAAELWAHGAFSHRYRFRHADGRWIWVDEWARLVRDEEGRPREMIVALADATRRVEEERRASERDEFLKSLVMVAPFAIGVLDAEGKLVFGNPAGVRMFAAQSFAELEGLDPAEVLHPDDRARAKRRIADFLA
ncbi:MAG: CBS domain-containing protein, partial [Zetaproteobacteria bacterium]